MSTLDWKRLAPHEPVARRDGVSISQVLGLAHYVPGTSAYVERPFDGGDRLAQRVRAGLSPLAVAGAFGCGKSTELAVAARTLEPEFAVVLARLDRVANMRGAPADASETARMVDAIARLQADSWVFHGVGLALLEVAQSRGVQIDSNLRGELSREPSMGGVPLAPRDAFLQALRTLKAGAPQGRVALLVDGLEKAEDSAALAAVRLLLSFRDEAALVFVVPSSLVTGPGTYSLSSDGVRLFPLRAIPTYRREGMGFLKAIAMKRLGLTELSLQLDFLFSTAARASGGLPRMFLQILQDAAGYASLEQREVPEREDLRNAVMDHMESIQRLLREGDRDVLQDADGHDGSEVPLERRLRLVSQGLLLEYPTSGGRMEVHPHPLVSQSALVELRLV
ncbi:MAG TPA: hypothetical protein VE057_23310 [Archangium sp.]|nr:hypothetical protein [Archangium sp.]